MAWTHLDSHHHIEMALRILLDDVAYIVRFSRLLEFSTCDEIFDFAYRPDGVAMGLSKSAKKDTWRRTFLKRNEKSMLIDANLSMMSFKFLLCHTCWLNIFVGLLLSFNLIACRLGHGTCLTNKWLTLHSTCWFSFDWVDEATKRIYFDWNWFFPSLDFPSTTSSPPHSSCESFNMLVEKKTKREKQGNIDPAGKEEEKARRKRDRGKRAGNKSLVVHSTHTGRDGGISYFMHATKEYRIITEIEYRSLLACWGRKMCSAQSCTEIGSRWNRNYFFLLTASAQHVWQ